MTSAHFARLATLSIAGLTLAAAAPAPPAPSIHQVQLYSYGYAPGPIVLRAGEPVTLQFVNRAGKSHDFTARAFFAASRILSGTVADGEVDLDAGETKAVTLVPARGTYHAHCGHPFHKMLGMHTDIVVR